MQRVHGARSAAGNTVAASFIRALTMRISSKFIRHPVSMNYKLKPHTEGGCWRCSPWDFGSGSYNLDATAAAEQG